MKEFNISLEHCVGIITRKEWNTYTTDGRVPTAEEMLLILQGKGQCSMIGSDDHPKFATLRNQLEAEGYIKTCRQSWNGDRVLKPFALNGIKFEVNDKFSSGAAMRYQLDRPTII